MVLLQLGALYLAGLGFFFTGVSGISESLRLLSGHRFRVLLGRATNHPATAALLGVAMGALTQNATVVAFILTGMVSSGMLAMRRALLVLACASIGTALLVFIAAVDLHLPVLIVIGVSGVVMKLWSKWRPGLSGVFSIGMLLFGLETMKQAIKPLSDSTGAIDLGKFLDLFPDAAFFAGGLLRSLIHSSSAAAAISITVSKTGRLSDYPAMMAVAGLGLGSAVMTYLMSVHLKGVARQISLHQAATNLLAGGTIAALLSVERMSKLPLLMTTFHAIARTQAERMAMMYLSFDLCIVAVTVVTLRWATGVLDWVSPATPEEDLSQPRYLNQEALRSPETALDLVALEQMRVMVSLHQYLEWAKGELVLKPAAVHGAVERLCVEIGTFLDSLVKLPIAAELAERVIAFQRKQKTLEALEENVHVFAETLGARHDAEQLAGRLIEGLDTLVMTGCDALQTMEAADVEMLIRLTDDRGGMMERLRGGLRVEERGSTEAVSAQHLSALHYGMTLFERNVWLLRQLALWMREDGRTAAKRV